MAAKIITFASIYVGTYEVSMKIFELSTTRKRIKQIDQLKKRLDLGQDIIRNGRFSSAVTEELCQVLGAFNKVMKGYALDDYRAFAGPYFLSAQNHSFVIDQIKVRANIELRTLSNSEHRFISYQSVASMEGFDSYTKEGAAVVDIGGASLQITVFIKGKVVTTQHLVLGTLRIKEKMENIGTSSLSNYKKQIREQIDKEMEVFREMYLQKDALKYVILIGDYCTEIMSHIERKDGNPVVATEPFLKYLHKLQNHNLEHLAEELNLSNEKDPLVIPALLLIQRTTEELAAQYAWVPGASISSGIAYHYARQKKLLPSGHDYEEDVRSAAINMAKRYNGYTKHVQSQVEICKILFDAMKKNHGMGKRERLLLEVAAILHDSGKYISFVNAPDCSYDIIMASEIIGLSHEEREIVACVVKYNVSELDPYDDLADKLDQVGYGKVAKLCVILRLANALDRSHKQKIKKMKASLKEGKLLVTVETEEDISLEKSAFEGKIEGFEFVYGISPVLHERRVY